MGGAAESFLSLAADHRAATLVQHHQLVNRHTLKNLRNAADPADYNSVDPLVLPQSEVELQAMMTLVAAPAVDLR